MNKPKNRCEIAEDLLDNLIQILVNYMRRNKTYGWVNKCKYCLELQKYNKYMEIDKTYECCVDMFYDFISSYEINAIYGMLEKVEEKTNDAN